MLFSSFYSVLFHSSRILLAVQVLTEKILDLRVHVITLTTMKHVELSSGTERTDFNYANGPWILPFSKLQGF